ncbi:MAG: triosephosphate isomerase [Dinoroseobacter sp.]|jgi:triosephosphate isomerase
MRTKFAAGNWKMNGTIESLTELAGIAGNAPSDHIPEVLICPPATFISRAADAARGTALHIGGQDCHQNASGAHTGDVSALMLRDAGATHVILGHSERRADHAESDALICAKTQTGWDHGLTAIVCIGETDKQRDQGNTLDIIGGQLANSIPDGATGQNLIVAYEPVWAIGTGRTPTLDQIGEVHDYLRMRLEERFGSDIGQSLRILYGGSVKPSNAAEIFAVSNVDGALVGGASLKASDFGVIIAALSQA